jgi:hypothetical protein
MTVLPSQSPVVTANPVASGIEQSVSDKVTLSSEGQALLAAETPAEKTPEPEPSPTPTPMSGGGDLPPWPPEEPPAPV